MNEMHTHRNFKILLFFYHNFPKQSQHEHKTNKIGHGRDVKIAFLLAID